VKPILAGIVMVVILVACFAYAGKAGKEDATDSEWIYAPAVGALLLAYLGLLLSGPYVMVRMNNLAWSATSFPGMRIECGMKARGYLWLQTVNVLLTLLTLGLFRPFAAVRVWRYRVAHLRVHAPEGVEAATLRAACPSGAAAGDGAADFFGVDLSW
jgi:uncharacterized membrane protein YjgN (DUF898 family)